MRGSGDAELRGLDPRIAFALLAATVVSLAIVVWMLDWPSTAQNLTIIGGLAGGGTALLSLMLGTVEFSAPAAQSHRMPAIRSRWIAAVFTYPAGFLAGSFSLLASLAFLQVSPVDANMPGAAMLGGIYGLVLGAYWARAIESAASRDTLLAPSVSAIAGRLTAPPARTNWSGDVVIAAQSIKGDIVIGQLKIWFEPKAVQKDVDTLSPNVSGGAAKSSPSVSMSRTPLTIQDGDDGTHAEFVITVSGGEGRSAFPRRQVARVPTEEPSQDYLFKLVVDQEKRPRSIDSSPTERRGADGEITSASDGVEGGASYKDSANHTGRAAAVLVDISMAGRTIQVIETRLAGGHK